LDADGSECTTAEMLIVDGKVGIGITGPTQPLHVYTTTSDDNGGHIKYENANTGAGAVTNAQLIGKSRYGTLQNMVWEDKGARIGMRSTANGGAGNVYFTAGTDSIRGFIDGANGNFGINTLSPRGKLDVVGPAGTAGWPVSVDNLHDLGGGVYRLAAWYTAGTYRADVYWNGAQILYTTGSDYRLKENLKPAANALSRIMELPVFSFNMKDDPDKNESEGFLAHDLQTVAPYAVSGIKDQVDDSGKPVYQTVDYGKLTPLLTAAVQELKAENDDLRVELEQLKSATADEIGALRSEIHALRETAF
ncbi:MAG: tail fiber domain-containing protein, partial [Candidatus Wallbacteria bacterium]|nr:tail fiber domain-containing protein [Candidatus Wallbacteria bacterium]